MWTGIYIDVYMANSVEHGFEQGSMCVHRDDEDGFAMWTKIPRLAI